MPKAANNPHDAPEPGSASDLSGAGEATTGQDAAQLDAAARNSPTRPSDAGRPRTPGHIQRTAQSRLGNRGQALDQEWRQEFPYHWRADDVVTRRDTLRFLVGGSAALVLATGALAVAGSIPIAGSPRKAIAKVDELGPGEWRTFVYPDQYSRGILINLPNQGLVAYSDACTHLSCAVLYNQPSRELHCPCHEGVFSASTGRVISGPPPRPLPKITLQVEHGTVYATGVVQR